VAFPGICKTKTGRLLVVYREGLNHAGGRDGRVMMTKSDDLGRTWSEPWQIYDDPEVDDRNSALLCTADGTIVHVWNKYCEGRDLGVFLVKSHDEARSWSRPIPIGAGQPLRTHCHPLEIRTPTGDIEWLLPLYDCVSQRKAAYVGIFRPEDNSCLLVPVTPVGDRNVSDEWALEQAADGRLVALVRSNWDLWLWQSESWDQGRTWHNLRPSSIPSQFTPPDLLRLQDGRLMVTFSFRERCNERQAVSPDNGESWAVAQSVDVFGAKLRGDRSYPAAVQLDDHTIGTVLYETLPAPHGGTIWFARTKLADLERPAVNVWYSDAGEELAAGYVELTAVERAPADRERAAVAVDYRFTGRFGEPLHGLELVLSDEEGTICHGRYWMGGGRGETNYIELALTCNSSFTTLRRQSAIGGFYNDGNNHQMSLELRGRQLSLVLDNIDQAAVPLPAETDCQRIVRAGVIAHRTGVALFDLKIV